MAPVIGSDGFSDCNKLCDPESGYSSSCRRICKDTSVGNDEFTDCSYVCNPINSMQWSCNEFCPGYEFVAPTTTTDGTTTRDKVNDGTNEDTFIGWFVICVISFTIIVIVICCFKNKERMRTFVQTCRDKRLQFSTQVQTPTTLEIAESRTRETGEDGAASPWVLHGNANDNNQTTDPRFDFRDSGISVDSASVHFVNDCLDEQIAIDIGNSATGSYNRPQDDETSRQGNDEIVTHNFVTEGDTIPKNFEEQVSLAIGQRMPFLGRNMILHT